MSASGPSPVSPIVSPFSGLALAPGEVIPVAFALVFFVWAVYTLVIAYHWLRYGHQSGIAWPALVAHLIISVLLALYAVSGLAT